jgi:hypothetical protein
MKIRRREQGVSELAGWRVSTKLVACGLWLVAGGLWLVACGWWLVAGGWELGAGSRKLMAGGKKGMGIRVAGSEVVRRRFVRG